MAAEPLHFDQDSDTDLAFHLQMVEAIADSLTLNPSTSHYSEEVELDDVIASLISEDLMNTSPERRDHELSQIEMMKQKEDLSRRIHDQKFASEILNMPDDEWNEYGDDYQRPYGTDVSTSGSSPSALRNTECFRVYFKGLVSEERVGDEKVTVAAIGAAVCDSRDNLLIEVSKRLESVQGSEVLSSETVELMALIEGLQAALAVPLERVSFFCDDWELYLYVTGLLRPRLSKVENLVNKVASLQREFTSCEPFMVAVKDVNLAFRLAKDTIVSQISLPAETGERGNLLENCSICFEDTESGQMFTIDGCLHRYCFSCMKQHVEVKFLGGLEAKCPHEGCESSVSIESCNKLLPQNLVEIISQRLKESSIPASEKVYCPDPRCSTLMSKTEVFEYSRELQGNADKSGARQCMKCHRLFCIKCKTAWHLGMTCSDYIQSSANAQTEDAKLKSLATEKLWRQCEKCSHLVELAEGCYHITCRCGYEFCYTCGAEWKNKKPTCSCPIWDEHNIIHD